MKVALVYDHVTKIGGAERILEALHELYPEAPLYTPIFNPQKAAWAKNMKVISSFMQNLPLAKEKHELYPALPLLAIENFDFSPFDLVISITSKEAKGVITSPNTLHICYCLTPTRYLWSHYSEYFKNPLLKLASLPFIPAIRLWDFVAAQRPDFYIAISEVVKKRIHKYYRRESDVIYPPVDIERFDLSQSKAGNYFLIVSRLVAYKRIDLAIDACNRLRAPLKIIGAGRYLSELRKKAGPTIEFLGAMSDTQLVRYFLACKAFIMPQEEDFGIAAVEALAAGKPVVAYSSGGGAEIVNPGVTGELFWPQNTDALVSALDKCLKTQYNTMSCRKQAERFSKGRFKQEFKTYIINKWETFVKRQRL